MPFFVVGSSLMAPKGRGECVVMVVYELDKCRALRLRALVEFSGGRDVVLLRLCQRAEERDRLEELAGRKFLCVLLSSS